MSTVFVFLASAALTTALNATPVPAYGPQAGEKPTYNLPAQTEAVSTTTTARPGEIRPASQVLPRDKQYGRNFACADSSCKTTTPAYNTRTPIEEERGRLAAD